jgi:hypothetical protein
MTIKGLKELLSNYDDDEQILMGDFLFESELKGIIEKNGDEYDDSDVDEIIDRWEHYYNKLDNSIIGQIISEVVTERLDSENNKIERWLHTSSEPFDDYDWDGSELLIFNETMLDGTEVSERYTRQDLKEEKVI